MTKKQDGIEDLFSDENEAQSNWFKFNKIGDRVGGILVEKEELPAKGKYGPQTMFGLEQPDGTIVRVGIPKSKKGTLDRANTARMGDTLGFEFVEEIPPTEKGMSPAKALKTYITKRKDSEEPQA